MDYEPYDSSGELLPAKIKPFCVSLYGFLLKKKYISSEFLRGLNNGFFFLLIRVRVWLNFDM